MKAFYLVTGLTTALLTSVSFTLQGGEVTFSGRTFSSWTHSPFEEGFVALGTFDPSFDPYEYGCEYADDEYCNMLSSHYGEAVAEGVFRPIGTATINAVDELTGEFDGSGLSIGLEGQQLWLFLFDDPNPDLAANFILCSGTDSFWFAPSDAASAHIIGDSADEFVFGSGGRGGPLEFGVLPFPESSGGAAVSLGFLVWTLSIAGRRCRKPVSKDG